MPLQAKIIAILAVLAGCFMSGYKLSDLKWSEKVATAENKAHKLNDQLKKSRAGATYLLEQSINDILDDQEVQAKVVYREKIVYRESPNAGTCDFPIDGLQVINSAASLPRDTQASSATNEEAPEKITDIQVVDLVTENYRTCLKEMAKLDHLQQWVEMLYHGEK